MKYILGIDPSGDGSSGFCLMENTFKIINISELDRRNYSSDVLYWNAHLEKIKIFTQACNKQIIIAIEDFLFNPKRANQFAGSRMDTSKLIGIIQYYCNIVLNIPVQMIKPLDHLSRFKDSVLCNLNIIIKTPRGYNTVDGISLSNHTKDALRIATFYNKIYGELK